MAYPPEVRAAVRAAYIYQRLALVDAAAAAGVPEGTARSWQRAARHSGDDWDAARSAASLSREGQLAVASLVLEQFVLQFQATLERLKGATDMGPIERAEILARLSDSYTKMMSAAGKVATPISRLGVAMETIRTLSRFIAERRPDALDTFADMLDEFGSHLAETING
jgi:transposase-like protein